MQVELVTITPDAEAMMIKIARVSNPSNQDNPEYSRLLRYCIQHQHWSVFEQAHMTIEVETSRAIATQLLRHRSMAFQEWSQRYSDPTSLGFEAIEWRMQAEKNRQSSLDLADPELVVELQNSWDDILGQIQTLYDYALSRGIAKECARFILPLCTTTKLYLTGNIRSWIHYIQLRTQPDTQLEHRQVALAAQRIFIQELPVTADALGWTP